MKSWWKGRSRLDKIILISVVTSALFMTVFWLMLKRTNRSYYLPANYSGWVTIRHSTPGAPQLPEKDGALQIVVPDSGVLYTATRWEYGWGRDLYFVPKPEGGWRKLPRSTECGNHEVCTQVHRHEYRPYAHSRDFATMERRKEYRMWDGAVITVYADDDVSYKRGKKSVETFFFSGEPQPVSFAAPKNPKDVTVETSDEYHIGE
jgi:hypothetical protein